MTTGGPSSAPASGSIPAPAAPSTTSGPASTPSRGEKVMTFLRESRKPENLIRIGVPASIVAAVALVIDGCSYNEDDANNLLNQAVATQLEDSFDNKGESDEDRTKEGIVALSNVSFENGRIVEKYSSAIAALRASTKDHISIENISLTHPETSETRTATIRINDPVEGGVEGVIFDKNGNKDVFIDDDTDISENRLNVRASIRWNGKDSPESDREENIWAALAVEGALKKVSKVGLSN